MKTAEGDDVPRLLTPIVVPRPSRDGEWTSRHAERVQSPHHSLGRRALGHPARCGVTGALAEGTASLAIRCARSERSDFSPVLLQSLDTCGDRHMKGSFAILLSGAIVATAVFCVFRWEVTAAAGVAYRLDRWTGQITSCVGSHPVANAYATGFGVSVHCDRSSDPTAGK